MLLLQHLMGSFKRICQGNPRIAIFGLATLAVAGSLALGFQDLTGISSWRRILLSTPGAKAYAGVVEFIQGSVEQGIALTLPTLVWTAFLLVITVFVHSWEVDRETRRSRWGGSLLGSRPLTHARRGVARLFFSEVLSSRRGRLLAAAQVASIWIFTLVLHYFMPLMRDEMPLEESHLRTLSRFEDLPIVAISIPLLVLLNQELWLNQFGWSGRGLRSVLLLPISKEDHLSGRLEGLLRVQGLQAILALAPLVAIRRPSLHELIWGLAAGAIAALATAAIGHAFSAQYPRPISRDGLSSTRFPLNCILFPIAIVVGTAVFLRGCHAIFSLAGYWGPAIGMPLLAWALFALYRHLLPGLARLTFTHRERLLVATRTA